MRKQIQITDLRVQKAIVLYKSGKAMRPISKELKLDIAVIKKFLIQEGILLTASERLRKTKSDAIINDNALDVLTPDALYWIGFLWADGHIAKGRPRIILKLSEIDKEHVQKFANFFGEGLALMKVEGEWKKNGYFSNVAYRAGFSSKRIYDRLVDLGFTNRKTYEGVPSEVMRNSRDFWRGVVDGDGSLYINKGTIEKYDTPVLSLYGNEATVSAFLNYVGSLGIQVNATLLKSKKSSVLRETNIKADKLLINTLNVLYKDANIYLDRKYKKYLEILKNQQNDRNT